MPINDERRRFGRTKATSGTGPQAAVPTKGEPGQGGGVQESLQMLQDMLVLQRGEQAEFRGEEEKRIEASKQTVQRVRNERNEKYERMQQAFERMNRWRDEDKAEAAGEESKRVQGTRSLSYLFQDLVGYD